MNIELQFMKDFFLFSEHFIERTFAMGVKFMKCKINDNCQGSKFMVANVQFATGLRTFASKGNNVGANLFLQHWPIFIITHFLLLFRPNLLLKFWT